ncbi:MAG: hypothetical protein Q9184_001432 [Pyrenodesmia sp. 2 TL-2023]
MPPMESPKGKRRWTLNRSRDIAEENSDEDYGEEILPTVDQEALATLPLEDQEKFKKMRKKDKKNIIARWRREGKPVPETNESSSSGTSGSSRPPTRTLSAAPQLPELQMDVIPRDDFSSAFGNARVASSETIPDESIRSLGAIRSELSNHPHLRPEQYSHTTTPHHQDLSHLPVPTNPDQGSAHTSLIAHPQTDSEDAEDSEDASLWLRIMDATQRTRGRRGIEEPSHNPVSQVADPSTSEARETPEQRRLRQLRDASSTFRNVTDKQELEYARFRGIGPVPPGLALGGNPPSASERVHAQTVTNVNEVYRATGQVVAHNAIAVARRGAMPVQSINPGQREYEAEREKLFVRPGRSVGQDIVPVHAWRGQARAHGMQLSPPSTVNTEGRDMPSLTAMQRNDSMEGLEESMGNVKISPMKRMAKKVGDGIKGLFNGKRKRAKPRGPERPPSRLRLHDEARVATATAVSMTPMRTPQATQHLSRAPPTLQPASAVPQGRPADPRRRTTRAMMENYEQTGRKAQLSNITAAKTVADIIRSCLGPNAMLKMLLDPMGGIALTNDGHAILREIEVAHPAAKNMIELSRTQDEEVGDGTTTVIILAGEILAQALPQLERNIHPVVIISAFKRALNDALNIVSKVSVPVDIDNDQQMYRLISSAIDTKYAARWSQMMCSIALKAVRTVSHDAGGGKKEVDIKRYAKVEKVPGGQIEDSKILDGVMLNKDITHPKMRRRIENPRVVLLDCPLEYKKGESQTNIEISKEEDWNRILQIEEEQVKIMTDAIIAVKPDVVITEKGVSDLAQHFLVKQNITALRRVRKTDNNRIARATGATIVNRVEDLQESDVGTQCGLFEIEKIGDEYFTFITKCKGPKACTILLRGPSKDILNEIERNLQDAMLVARNVVFHPRLSPGGGATEMAVSVRLAQLAKEVEGVQQWPYKAVAEAMEVIPRTLIQNSGSSPIRVLTKLRAKHAEGQHTWGIDGYNGTLVDMKQYGTWEPEAVKVQSIKTAVEAACLLLRVDDICSAKSAKQSGGNMGGGED